MRDSYLEFVNSGFGGWVTSRLGLPRPVRLHRHQAPWPVLEGDLLVGAAQGAELIPALVNACASMKVDTLADVSVPQWTALANEAGLMSGRWAVGDRPGASLQALVFDASGLRDPVDSGALHAFLHASIRSVRRCGRIVLLGRPPESCDDPVHAAAQRALAGLVRSIAKEVRRGITAQLLWVANGAEASLEGALRFFLAPRSAYVSGQCLSLSEARAQASAQVCRNWLQPLADRTVVVTGASRGIGAAIAQVLARDGARVVCVDIPETGDALESLATRLGARALRLDITAANACEQLVEAARADGGWDGVIHNAGITRDRTIARMPTDQWQSVIAVNLRAPIRINDALVAADALRPGARIVCVSSISGIAGNAGQTNYAFSKAGLIGLVERAAPGFAARSMSINAVAPGFIETDMTARMPRLIREAGRRMNSMAQGGLPVDVAEAVSWLVSPAASGVNGQVLRVCGQSLIGA